MTSCSNNALNANRLRRVSPRVKHLACGAPVVAGLQAPDLGVNPIVSIPLVFAALIALCTGMLRLKVKTLNVGKYLPEFTTLEYLWPVHLQPPQPGIAEPVEQGADNLAHHE
jgi:hypothetical protein